MGFPRHLKSKDPDHFQNQRGSCLKTTGSGVQPLEEMDLCTLPALLIRESVAAKQDDDSRTFYECVQGVSNAGDPIALVDTRWIVRPRILCRKVRYGDPRRAGAQVSFGERNGRHFQNRSETTLVVRCRPSSPGCARKASDGALLDQREEITRAVHSAATIRGHHTKAAA